LKYHHSNKIFIDAFNKVLLTKNESQFKFLFSCEIQSVRCFLPRKGQTARLMETTWNCLHITTLLLGLCDHSVAHRNTNKFFIFVFDQVCVATYLFERQKKKKKSSFILS